MCENDAPRYFERLAARIGERWGIDGAAIRPGRGRRFFRLRRCRAPTAIACWRLATRQVW